MPNNVNGLCSGMRQLGKGDETRKKQLKILGLDESLIEMCLEEEKAAKNTRPTGPSRRPSARKRRRPNNTANLTEQFRKKIGLSN